LKSSSIMLAAAMLGASLLFGCGTKQDYSDTNTPAKQATVTSTDSDGAPPRTPVHEQMKSNPPMPPPGANYPGLKGHPLPGQR